MDTPNKIRNLLLKVIDGELKQKQSPLLSSPKTIDDDYCVNFTESFSANSIETTPSSLNVDNSAKSSLSCKICTIEHLSNGKTYLKKVCSLFKKSRNAHIKKKTQSCKFGLRRVSKDDKEAFLLRCNSRKKAGKSSFFVRKTYSVVNTSLSESN